MIHRYHFDPLDPIDPYSLNMMPQVSDDPEATDRAAMYGCLSFLAAPVIFIILFCIVSLLFGCTTTKVVPVERVTHDTVRITKVEKDSVFLRDSIYVHEYTKGDTVFLQVEKWHTQYRDRWRTDTAYISRRDSIPVPYPVEKRVPAELNWWQQARLWLANIILIALAILAAWWIVKKKAWWLALLRKIV